MVDSRNIGIIAHIDAGKTTLSERFLFYSGREHRMGEVHEGTAHMDYLVEEQERGITITSAATTFNWKGTRINLIDTPGHVDFTAEVERSLRVLDGAIGVFCGVAGVEAQSETVWRQADHYQVPRLAFINKLDRVGADFFRVFQDIQDTLHCRTLALYLPIGSESEFEGVIDLLRLEEQRFTSESLGQDVVVTPIAPERRELAELWRAELIERVAEHDDEVMEIYLQGKEAPSVDLLRHAIRRGTLRRLWIPVVCGAAFRNKGVQSLLDSVVAYLPAPTDISKVMGIDPRTQKPLERATTAKESLVALLFKVQIDQHGELSYLRIYSGRLERGQQCVNTRSDKKERVANLYRMHANLREAIDVAEAGDIVAVTGFRFSGTGDTLCDSKGQPILLERPVFPDTVISMAVEPRSSADRDRLYEQLLRLTREDPTFRLETHPETGQYIMAGMGELHLEVIRNRLIRDFKVDANIGNPRVSYRQTFRAEVTQAARYARPLGGKDHLGEVRLHISPAPNVTNVEVYWQDLGLMPSSWKSRVEESVASCCSSGESLKFPFIRIRVGITILDFQPQTTEIGLAMAAREAFAAAERAVGVDLLEPVMRFQISTPEEYFGAIHQDLARRRAGVATVEIVAHQRRLSGTVPLAEVFGYTTTLRSISQGRATISLEPIGFAVAPEKVAERFR